MIKKSSTPVLPTKRSICTVAWIQAHVEVYGDIRNLWPFLWGDSWYSSYWTAILHNCRFQYNETSCESTSRPPTSEIDVQDATAPNGHCCNYAKLEA